MSPLLEKLTREVDGLPVADQLDLYHHLRERFQSDDEAAIEAAWDEEIAGRADDIREGRIELMSGEEFGRRADALLKELGVAQGFRIA